MVDRIEPLTTTVAASLDAPRFAAAVVAGFASVAMVLAAVGLYGVLSYSVSQRVRELGDPRGAGRAARRSGAAGAARRAVGDVRRHRARRRLARASFTRLMQDLLFGVTPLDAVAFTVAPAVLVLAALAACLGPALRAAATDPAATLRS